MLKLLDKNFWQFLSGFILIIVLSFSILTVMGVWRQAKKSYAAIVEAFFIERFDNEREF